jgi:hypothetical protein
MDGLFSLDQKQILNTCALCHAECQSIAETHKLMCFFLSTIILFALLVSSPACYYNLAWICHRYLYVWVEHLLTFSLQ